MSLEKEECTLAQKLQWRGIATELDACPGCGGSGVKTYGSTLTWRTSPGSFGGQMMTDGVCDKCWGSGDRHRPWANLRKLQHLSEKIERLTEELQEKNEG